MVSGLINKFGGGLLKVVLGIQLCMLSLGVHAVSKDVVGVLDVSKSMLPANPGTSWDKFQSSKDAIISVVQSLDDGDVFTLVLFGDEVAELQSRTVSGTIKAEIIEEIGAIEADSDYTDINRLLNRLSTILRGAEGEVLPKPQITLVFSDAVDDPRVPSSSNACNNLSREDNYVYLIFAPAQASVDLSQKLEQCFGSAHQEYQVDSAQEMSAVAERIYANFVAAVTPQVGYRLSGESTEYKAGEQYTLELVGNANQRADGYSVQFNLLPIQGAEDGNEVVAFTGDAFTLQSGLDNKFPLTVSVPLRADADYSYQINVNTSPSVPYGRPAQTVPAGSDVHILNLKVIPLTFTEKLTRLPEYYLPALLLLIILVAVLIYLYKYLTFVPIFDLHYWITPEGGDPQTKKKAKKKRGNKKGYEPVEEEEALVEPLKETIDLTTLEKKRLVFVGNQELAEENNANETLKPSALHIYLSELKKFDSIILGRRGQGRKLKVRSAGTWKAKAKNKLKFGGKLLKDKTYFTYGVYSFEVETNLGKKKKKKK